MVKETNPIIIIAVVLAALLFFQPTGLFSVVAFTGNELTEDADLFYQYAIEPESAADCSGTASWITDGGYVFAEESTINTGKSEFKFKVTNVKRIERSEAHICADVFYDIEVRKDGVLIDEIKSDDVEARIKDADSCTVSRTLVNSRAYADDGTVYKRVGEDFEDDEEKINLPVGVSGIEADFGVRTWRDTSDVSCRKNHIVNAFEVFQADVDINIISIEDIGNALEVKLEVNNTLDELTGSLRVLSDTSLGQATTLGRQDNLVFSPGINEYTIVIDVSDISEDFELTPEITLSASTSRLSNINGRAIFSDETESVDASQHTTIPLGDIRGNTFTFNVQGELVDETNETDTTDDTSDDTTEDEEEEESFLAKYGLIGGSGLLILIIAIIAIVVVVRRK